MARFVSALLLAALVGLSSARSVDEELFRAFKSEFGKKYGSETEEAYRFQVFQKNMASISESPTSGVTQFADLTPMEFKTTFTGRLQSDVRKAESWDGECTACKRFPELNSTSTPANFDWTTKGAVTGVKNQGQCGSCWSFGTTGDIEGTWFLAGNSLTSLSEQELVSCDDKGNDQGCGGGLQEDAFDWIIKRGGIVSEHKYPYKSGSGNSGTCKSRDESPDVSHIKSWYQVSSSASGETKIMKQLSQVGPITIGINATPMQMYTGGIDDPRNCDPSQLDHAVLIVGYGEENGTKFWKIKNSWGTSWGEDGYYRIVRGSNKCGLANDAVHSQVN